MATRADIVLRVIVEHPGLTESEVARVIFGPGGYQQQVSKIVRELIQQGLVSKFPRNPDGKNGLFAGTIPGSASVLSGRSGVDATPSRSVQAHIEPGVTSAEYLFSRQNISAYVPQTAGTYLFLLELEYPRYEGTSRILKIGISERDLRLELLNHLNQHVAANRIKRIQSQQGLKVSFCFRVCEPDSARYIEKEMLKSFEDEHFDLPLLNRQGGYLRGEDVHYR